MAERENAYVTVDILDQVFCLFVLPVRFCYHPLKQWVAQFDNEKC